MFSPERTISLIGEIKVIKFIRLISYLEKNSSPAKAR
jgi:hypothetical protein